MADSSSRNDRPGAVAWQLIQPHWEQVNIYDGEIVFRDGFARLSDTARHLIAVVWCDSEVCNGGFHQFFSNSTGVLAPEALAGFSAIGLSECAQIVDAAIAKLGRPYPRDREARQAELRAIKLSGSNREDWDPFYNLDGRYYAAKKRDRFGEKLDDFARRKGP